MKKLLGLFLIIFYSQIVAAKSIDVSQGHLVFACTGFGIVDQQGKILVEPKFSWINPFKNGKTIVDQNNNGVDNWQYIDKSGAIIKGSHLNNNQLIGMSGFVSAQEDPNKRVTSLLAIKVGNKWGFKDKTGSIKISPQFFAATDFVNHIAQVTLNDKNHSVVFINETGQIIFRQGQWYQLADSALTPQVLNIIANYFKSNAATSISLTLSKVKKFIKQKPFADTMRVVADHHGHSHLQVKCSIAGNYFADGVAKVSCGNQVLNWHGLVNREGKFIWAPDKSCPNPPSGP